MAEESLIERIDNAIAGYTEGAWPIETEYEKRMVPLLLEARRELGTFKKATDALSLKYAKQICAHVAGPTVAGKLTNMYKAIRDYIDILEGKE